MRHLVVLYILRMVPKGQVIQLQKLYSGIYSQFPVECQKLGLTANQRIEVKWKNEIRFGLRLAVNQRLIKHVGMPKSGEWQRI